MKVGSGYSDTTVDALVTTAEGEIPVLLILDDDGKLLAWKVGGDDIPIETSAQSFTEELAAGRWVQARSRLQIDFQKELAPGDLERKWTKLTRVSGGFRAVKDAVVASQGGEQHLVLVCVEFGKATTNLFVFLTTRAASSTSTSPAISSTFPPQGLGNSFAPVHQRWVMGGAAVPTGWFRTANVLRNVVTTTPFRFLVPNQSRAAGSSNLDAQSIR